MSYYQKKRVSTMIDNRFRGRSIEIYVMTGDKFLGLIDEVSQNEIGIIAEENPIIVPRNSILYVVTGLSDVHGHGECCESEYVLDENFIGSDVIVKLSTNEELSGRIIKLTRNEIGLAQGNRAIIIPRVSIVYVKIVRR